ncbi:MAG: histidine phosphatase family protein, partial [Cyclobacteriaceae bacterium]|nr:histidine phosphatase family protein [Cyclobacteriaceae bacterium HetDA_MAG_MS6]
MTLKKIYIVRHGETDYNKRNMVQGRGIDASLNETGRQQAESFYQAYKNTSFDKLYISMLKRTNESMAGFIRDGLPFERMAGFDEISWGNQEGVPFSEESHTLYQETTKRWQAGDLTANVGGGENPVQVMERQKQAMDIVLSRSAEKQILICM